MKTITITKEEDYKCALCEARGVKLWCPLVAHGPLICATCAEDRQVKGELPRWIINDGGEIPLYYDFPSSCDEYQTTTNRLHIDLSDVASEVSFFHHFDKKNVRMMPIFLKVAEASDSEDDYVSWNALPTRITKNC